MKNKVSKSMLFLITVLMILLILPVILSTTEFSNLWDDKDKLEYIEIEYESTKMLMHDEGFRYFPYIDSLGFRTIGYGFKMSKYDETKFITEQEAKKILQIKIFTINKRLQKLKFYKDLKIKQKVAIISMAYQLGFTGLSKFKDTLKALEDEKYTQAKLHARDSLWCRQTKDRCIRVTELLSE